MWLCCHPSDGQTPALKNKKKCMKPNIRTSTSSTGAQPQHAGLLTSLKEAIFLIFCVCGLVCVHLVCVHLVCTCMSAAAVLNQFEFM